jgi:hypothetical protein
MGLMDRVLKAFSTDESELARHGRVPIPGEATLSLPAGEIKLTYQQGFIDPSFLTVPKELEVTVTGTDGEDLPVSRPLLARSKSASSVEGYFRQRIGTVTIPSPSEYVVRVGPPPPELGNEPIVLVGD